MYLTPLPCVSYTLFNQTYNIPTIPIYTAGTSLTLVPSGRIAVAGFSDGTLRLLDLTGLFARDRNDPRNFVSASATDKSQLTRKTKKKNELDELFDDD